MIGIIFETVSFLIFPHEFLKSLFRAKLSHIKSEVPGSVLNGFNFGAVIIFVEVEPWEYWVVRQIVVTSVCVNINQHQVLKVGNLSLNPLFSYLAFLQRFLTILNQEVLRILFFISVFVKLFAEEVSFIL